MSVFYCTSNQL